MGEDKGDHRYFNREVGGARLTARAVQRLIAIGFFGFLAAGCTATLVSLVIGWRQYDPDLLQSTDEVSGLISRIYEYRKSNAKYPRSLKELRPIAGDVASKHEKDYSGGDENFCATLCWRYLYRGDVNPPALFRSLHHGNLSYEFASSSDYSYPRIVDEGWVASYEGSRRYLRSFFSKDAVPSGRK